MIDHATKLARLALQFSRVERATRHEDGIRSETDADHVIMLSLVACALAPAGLSTAKIAEFSLLHDLVEVYAGDTQTLTLDSAGHAVKADRERAALARLRKEYGLGSWMVQVIESYERQLLPEARYVRLLDKVMPKLTHSLNGCVAARPLVTRDQLVALHQEQHFQLARTYEGDKWAQPFLDLLRDAMAQAEAAWPQDTFPDSSPTSSPAQETSQEAP